MRHWGPHFFLCPPGDSRDIGVVKPLFLGVLALVALAAAAALLTPRDDGEAVTAPDPYVDDFELPQEVRKHLWQIEQRAFVLHDVALGALATALELERPEPWAASLAPGTSAARFAWVKAAKTKPLQVDPP